MQKWIEKSFVFLVLLALFTPFLMFKDFFFPYVTSKAFYFRVVTELALPLYLYLIIAQKSYRPRLKNPLVIFAGLFLVLSLISAFAGVNVSRGIWGNFERMGGVFYLAHLTLLFLYVQILGQLVKDKNSQGQTYAVALVTAVLIFLFFRFTGLSVAISFGAAFIICGISLAILLLEKDYLRCFLDLAIIAAILTVINGIFGNLGWSVLFQDFSLPQRVSSTLGNPIFFASFLILPLSLAVFFAFSAEQLWRKIYYYFSALLMLVGIYQSGTRGALVGIIAAVFLSGTIYFLLSLKAKKTQKFFLAVFVCLLLLGTAGFTFSGRLPEGNLRRIFSLNDSNAKARLIQWKTALAGFKERPFLGTGPENYYVIADKYFNPAIYQYDSSWFDKPHNYFLEVLTTGGSFGFLAYLGFLSAIVWALASAYKARLASAAEFSALLGGFAAYNAQNFFVFDTVSASVMFFAFAGFAGYLWQESRQETAVQKSEIKAKSQNWLKLTAAITALASGPAVLYLLYAANFVPMEVSKNVQYGRAYASYDYKAAAGYFEKARSLPFNFDKLETSARFADFAVNLAQGDTLSQDPDFVKDQLRSAYNYQTQIAESVGNYPAAWLRAANVKIMDDLANKRELGAEDEAPINKALALAPLRIELWQLLLQLMGYEQDWQKGLQVAQKIVDVNPYKPQFKLQLGLAYFKAGHKDKGVAVAEASFAQGYRPAAVKDFFWAAHYLFIQKEYKRAVPMLEMAVYLDPNNLDSFFLLAQSYAEVGDKTKARLVAEMIARGDPSKKDAVDEFIKTLKP